MKEQFEDWQPSTDSEYIVNLADNALREYMSEGYKVTLRQLYYHFISNGLFPNSWIDKKYNAREKLPPDTKNTLKNYKKFGGLIGRGRMAGMLDWDMVEDRGRELKNKARWDGPAEIVYSAAQAYKRDLLEGQSEYIELWCEKDALSGILLPICEKWSVALLVNKGYSSLSAMKEAGSRVLREAEDVGRPTVILYAGDHDPSGIDMVRDMEKKVEILSYEQDFVIQRIALTMDQIREHNLPEDPAKTTDPRASKYIAQYGNRSWELDALHPRVLTKIVDEAICDSIRDMDLWEAVLKKQEKERKVIYDFAKSI